MARASDRLGTTERMSMSRTRSPMGEHGSVLGIIQHGNIDLKTRRPVFDPSTGKYATVRSKSFSFAPGRETLIPTVVGNRIVNDKEAIDRYKKTGRHLGIYSSIKAADRAAEELHRSEEKRMQPFLPKGPYRHKKLMPMPKYKKLPHMTPRGGQPFQPPPGFPAAPGSIEREQKGYVKAKVRRKRGQSV